MSISYFVMNVCRYVCIYIGILFYLLLLFSSLLFLYHLTQDVLIGVNFISHCLSYRMSRRSMDLTQRLCLLLWGRVGMFWLYAREWIQVYVRLSSFDVHLKLLISQHCESTIFQNQIKSLIRKDKRTILGGSMTLLLSFNHFSHSVVSDSLWPHGLQHARLPCPSPAPEVYSNSCPSSQWCHPTISSSVILFSSCLQCFPASGTFPMSQFFTSGGQSIGVSALASVLPMNIHDWFPLGWTGLISLQSKGLSRVFSNTTVPKHQLFGTQLLSLFGD